MAGVCEGVEPPPFPIPPKKLPRGLATGPTQLSIGIILTRITPSPHTLKIGVGSAYGTVPKTQGVLQMLSTRW